jgi:hypothetical protein
MCVVTLLASQLRMDSALIRLRKELGEYEDLVWVSEGRRGGGLGGNT